MKNLTKRLLALALMLALAVTMIPVVNAQAATEKVTLYLGEVITKSPLLGSLQNVTTSNKKVVAVKKDGNKAIITTKKTGTATVTFKTNRGTVKKQYTVKARNLKVALKDMGGGHILLTVKNNTKQTFTSVDVAYVLKDADGNIREKKTKTVYDCVAGKTAYSDIYYSTYDFTADVKQCSAKVVDDYRSLSAKYKDESANVKTKVSKDDNGEDTLTLTLTVTNKSKNSVSGNIWILLYDVDNKVIGLKTSSIYLQGEAVKTDTQKINYGPYSYPAYDHYELVTAAYSYTY